MVSGVLEAAQLLNTGPFWLPLIKKLRYVFGAISFKNLENKQGDFIPDTNTRQPK